MKRNILKSMTAAIAALFIALLAMPQTAQAQSKEAYVVEDGSTLTFYYDANKATHTTGTVYGINDKRKDNTKFPAWAGTDGDPNERIMKVVFDSSFKDYRPATTSSWFSSCKKLTAIEGMSNLITDQVTDMRYMFDGCSALTSLDVSNFNTANVTYMYCMFYDCSALKSLNVSNFNTANVTDMFGMFSGCSALTSLNVSNFDTGNVTDMYAMFRDCSSLKSLDVTKFNTANVTDMSSMFRGCSALTSLDVSNFNTANVTDMGYMFNNCSALTSLDVSKFNTAKVTNMGIMFSACSALTSLDISNFNTANVTDMESMFSDCSALTSLDVSKFNTAKVTNMSTMFYGCSALTTIFCNDDWKSDVVKKSTDMFMNCIKLKGAVSYDQTKVDVTMANPTTGYFTKIGEITPVAYVVEDGSTLTFYYDTNKATHTTGTVYGINDKRKDDTKVPAWAGTDDDPNERITKVVFDSSFKDYRPATTNCWFYFCSKLTEFEGMSNLITEQVTDMYCMFNGCESLKALDVSKYNTAKVTDMKGMFCGCSALTSLDVSNFNTANVTDMSYMFVACSALETLDLSNFNTANVTYMNAMFYYCSSLTSLNVSNFDTGNVTDMYCMFRDCSSLKSLDVTKFNTAKVTDMMFMFNGCSSLTSIDVTNFNTAKVTAMSFMFSNCSSLTTIFCNDDWKSDVVQKSTDMFMNCTKLKGAVSYDANKLDVTMANPTTGYFTKIGEITPVAYVVEDGSTLTFYYDTNKATRTGTVYGINQKRADDTTSPAWAGTEDDPNERITKVVFDSSFKDYRPATTNRWFFFCKKLTAIEGMSNLITDQVTDISYMFFWCSSLTSIDVSNFNTANVTDMSYMFCWCSSLTSLDVSKFNTANVTDMDYMFVGCSALASLDVSNFNTAKVTNMRCMFAYCSALTSLDVSNFNTANVTNMAIMFYLCSALTSLDVSKFNTANVTDMSFMFSDCSALTTIFCNDDWKSDVVRNSPDMFKNCTKLKGAVAYNQTKVDVRMANPTTGYFTKKSATGIIHPTAAEPLKRQGIYNLQGVKMQGSLDQLPAGVYIADGKKIVKK